MLTCTKKYGHDLGLSCVFRQHRAQSHCKTLHGYAMAFTFEFGCREPDENGWVVDFGSLKPLKEWLGYNFDHTLVAAQDDPEMETLLALEAQGLVTLRVFPAVGCEALAKLAHDYAQDLVHKLTDGRVFVVSATVAEHGANCATYHSEVML